MAINVTTSFTDGTSSDAVQSFLNRRLLMRQSYDHFAAMFADNKPIGMRQGNNMIHRRYDNLARQTTELTEAVTPTSLSKAKTDVAIRMYYYGAYLTNSDEMVETQPEGVLEDVDLLSQNMGETRDVLYYLTWATGTNVTYANGSAEASVNTLPVYADFDKALRDLVNNKAKRMTPQISPSQKVGTGSIMPGYWCFLSNSMFYDIRAGSTFSGKFFLPSNYGNSAAMMGEGGALDIGIRLLPVPDEAMTAAGMIVAGGGATGGDATVIAETSNVADVHYAVMFGQQAVGGVQLGTKNGSIIRTGLGSAGSADPLQQRQTIGYKFRDGRGVLNQAFIQTVKSAVSN